MKNVVGFVSGSLTVIEGQYHKRCGKRNVLYVKSQCKCGRECEHKRCVISKQKATGCGYCKYSKYRKHGLRKLPEYNVYAEMLQRCNTVSCKKYRYYGGRGIKCLRDSFIDFYQDMGKRPSKNHSIDRIDNDGNYCKENCRRATMKEQSNNKRGIGFVEINGVNKTLSEWSEIYNIKHKTIYSRINNCGRDPIKAITTPKLKKSGYKKHNNYL